MSPTPSSGTMWNRLAGLVDSDQSITAHTRAQFRFVFRRHGMLLQIIPARSWSAAVRYSATANHDRRHGCPAPSQSPAATHAAAIRAVANKRLGSVTAVI